MPGSTRMIYTKWSYLRRCHQDAPCSRLTGTSPMTANPAKTGGEYSIEIVCVRRGTAPGLCPA